MIYMRKKLLIPITFINFVIKIIFLSKKYFKTKPIIWWLKLWNGESHQRIKWDIQGNKELQNVGQPKEICIWGGV